MIYYSSLRCEIMRYSIQTAVKGALEVNPRIRVYSTFSAITASTNEDLIDSYSNVLVKDKNN